MALEWAQLGSYGLRYGLNNTPCSGTAATPHDCTSMLNTKQRQNKHNAGKIKSRPNQNLIDETLTSILGRTSNKVIKRVSFARG